MIVGENFLNIDITPRGLYRVISADGVEKSGLFEYDEVHAICYSICVKEDCLLNEFTGYGSILENVPEDYMVWLDFSDGYYHARPTDYSPKWFEIAIGSVKEINTCLQQVCQRMAA